MFSTLLKQLRAQKGLTQSQLARKAHVSPGNVGDWETGKSKPGYNALAELARIFEVSADYLLELNHETKRNMPDENGAQSFFPTEHEAMLLGMLRLLPESQQDELFELIRFKYRYYVERKRGSTCLTSTNPNSETA